MHSKSLPHWSKYKTIYKGFYFPGNAFEKVMSSSPWDPYNFMFITPDILCQQINY